MPTPIKDLTGQQFGWLTALRATDSRRAGNGSVLWQCRCKCGRNTVASSAELRYGMRLSCGCRRRTSLQKAERDAAIRRQLDDGHTQAELAKLYGLTPQRLHQIARDH